MRRLLLLVACVSLLVGLNGCQTTTGQCDCVDLPPHVVPPGAPHVNGAIVPVPDVSSTMPGSPIGSVTPGSPIGSGAPIVLPGNGSPTLQQVPNGNVGEAKAPSAEALQAPQNKAPDTKSAEPKAPEYKQE